MAGKTEIRGALTSTLALVLACAAGQGVDVPEGARNADDLLVVDCLLPGQVRKLGQGATYMTPRRPIKTSAVDCEIRGGEYVAFDRASYADALRIWLPQAKAGDAQAQTYVGEIFEKGLGVEPDYAAAAEWYRRAAEQDYAPAQINLGQLYELGHGVPKDGKRALAWYRRAAGIGDLDAEFVSFVGDAEEYKKLRGEIEQQNTQVARLSDEVATLNRQLGQARQLKDDETASIEEGTSELVEAETALRRETEELAARRRQLEKGFSDLERERRKAQKSDASLVELENRSQALQQQKKELDAYAAALDSREAEVAQRQQVVEQKSRQLVELDAEIQRIQAEAEVHLAQYAQAVQPAAPLVMPGPSIQIVDPDLVLTRSTSTVALAVSSRDRSIVGRVEAPAGLLSLVVNDVEEQLDDDGFFDSRVRVRRVGTQVRIVAIDQQGKRTERSFLLRRAEPKGASGWRPEPVPLRTRDSGVDFGDFHALVIGNGSYPHMPDLMTSRVDALAVSEVLRERYGFEVTTLIDGDRYAILSALNELREKLDEEDNLIVYYAGHGEFDRDNDRGYWMPVDAEPGNTANWISNQSITDMVNAMRARHVMLIADSCYSGALTEAAIPRVDEDLGDKQRVSWQSLMVEKRSRTALTSGGLAPVLDGGGGEHSVFAQAFLDMLSRNDDVLDGRHLYEGLSARVTYRARLRSFEQEPRYAPIRFGGHEAGDFFFVPES